MWRCRGTTTTDWGRTTASSFINCNQRDSRRRNKIKKGANRKTTEWCAHTHNLSSDGMWSRMRKTVLSFSRKHPLPFYFDFVELVVLRTGWRLFLSSSISSLLSAVPFCVLRNECLFVRLDHLLVALIYWSKLGWDSLRSRVSAVVFLLK